MALAPKIVLSSKSLNNFNGIYLSEAHTLYYTSKHNTDFMILTLPKHLAKKLRFLLIIVYAKN
jgi:hypothetical protein